MKLIISLGALYYANAKLIRGTRSLSENVCSASFLEQFPNCSKAVQWMKNNWETSEWSETYRKHGVDGSHCSIVSYLHNIENRCPYCSCEQAEIEQCGTGSYPGFPKCASAINFMEENWNKVEWSQTYISGGVDGSTCSIQKYLAKYENRCPECTCTVTNENPSGGNCVGPYDEACENSMNWMLKNWNSVPWSNVYKQAGVDGSRCSVQAYLANEENICPKCSCEGTATPPTSATRKLGINLSIGMQQPSNRLNAIDAVKALGTIKRVLGVQNSIDRVKLFNYRYTAASLIAELAKTSHVRQILIAIQNADLDTFQVDDIRNLVQQYPRIEFHVAVGNEPYHAGVSSQRIRGAFDRLRQALPRQVLITVPFSMSIIGTSYPVEQGSFKSDFTSKYGSMLSKMDYFTINVYPFFNAGQEGIPIEMLVGESMQMLKNQLGATRAALRQHGQNDMDMVLGETGWPSDGSRFATRERSRTYFQNAAKFIESQASDELIKSGYLFEAFDENMKSGAIEQSFGILTQEGLVK
mmetsp:Transcript_23284/g.37099  ORF Transcript_23284/g.37099 Transcript_23284/m.37099 type:complete len:526 (-) Transcript_23284:38-1615(-)